MKNLGFIIILIVSIGGFSQNSTSLNKEYPENFFRNPLDIPLAFSGSFGELRTNHFHSGLDLRTLQREGLKVYTSAEGYVSRIKISHWGFGKAIYIRHPNGYTSVYAHLKKFSDRIEAYIKKQQYKKESFEIQVFPGADALPISKNEVIAFSGNTGGSMGPHLHFEIRDSRTEKPINPMFFGVKSSDVQPPSINTLVGYPINNYSHINGTGMPLQLTFKKMENGDLIADKINAVGSIGFGINVYDRINDASLKTGIYSLEMFVNGKMVHRFEADSFSFAETRYINLLIDYERLEKFNQKIHKSFIEPYNLLSLYDNLNSKGTLLIQDGLDYLVEIIVRDFKGNPQKLTIPIAGKEMASIDRVEVRKTPYKIDHNEFKKFTLDKMTLSFPKNSFYRDVYLDLSTENDMFKVHTPTLPLHKNYTLSVDMSDFTLQEKKQMYLARVSKKGSTNYVQTVKKENLFYTNTRTLGNYKLLRDSIAPTIALHKFKDEQWLSNHRTLKVKISDKESGIKSYRGEIDGKWILMEYNPKNGILTYDFKDKTFVKAEHRLKVTATDMVGNSKTLNATFFRKK
jgi:murein DD-endopeptidase MepM/ murein hydrolase activator NlpD